jgi:hypothetical protein
MASIATQRRDRNVVSAAGRPQLFCVGDDAAVRDRARVWPIGPALVKTLGDLNSDVGGALAAERARLSGCGYPEDLPLPALWWTPSVASPRPT